MAGIFTLPLENVLLYYSILPSAFTFPSVSAPGKGKAHVQESVKEEEPVKEQPKEEPKPTEPATESKKEDDLDLFGEDEHDEEYEKQLEERRKAAVEAKGGAKKKDVVAKSSLLLDVKPWDDETPMDKLEESVRSITMEGLTWGASKLVPVGYGIKKLQIGAVIVDDLVSVDDIEEKIVAFEDFVQSMDIAAFNKI